MPSFPTLPFSPPATLAQALGRAPMLAPQLVRGTPLYGFMSLGDFVFALLSAPLVGLARETRWRWASGEELGTLPTQQYLGREADRITLTGGLRPEITGDESTLDELRAMAQTGREQLLIDGNGRVWGQYVITSLQEERSALYSDGSARAIDFTLDLTRVDRAF